MPHGLCVWLEPTAPPVAERYLDRLGLDLAKGVEKIRKMDPD